MYNIQCERTGSITETPDSPHQTFLSGNGNACSTAVRGEAVNSAALADRVTSDIVVRGRARQANRRALADVHKYLIPAAATSVSCKIRHTMSCTACSLQENARSPAPSASCRGRVAPGGARAAVVSTGSGPRWARLTLRSCAAHTLHQGHKRSGGLGNSRVVPLSPPPSP